MTHTTPNYPVPEEWTRAMTGMSNEEFEAATIAKLEEMGYKRGDAPPSREVIREALGAVIVEQQRKGATS